jgi:hypothetical protein
MGDLGLIVAAYAFVRCLEMLCKPKSSFGSHGAQMIVCVAASLVMLLSLVVSVDMILSPGATMSASASVRTQERVNISDASPTPAELAKSRAEIQKMLDHTDRTALSHH